MKQSLLLASFILSIACCHLSAQQRQFLKSFYTGGGSKEIGYYIEEIRKTDCSSSGVNPIDSGYIILTDSFTLIRTNLDGDVLWSKHYDYSMDCFSDYVQQTSDCGFIAAGSLIDSANRVRYSLLKTDSLGNVLWNMTYEPPSGDSLFTHVYLYYGFLSSSYKGKIGVKARQTSDFGYVIMGQVITSGGDSTCYHLIKTDPNGQVMWSRYYNRCLRSSNGMQSIIYDLDLAGGHGFILSGSVIDTAGNKMNIELVRLDSLGSILWSKQYHYSNSPGQFLGAVVTECIDHGFILACGNLVLKIDSAGNFQWSRIYAYNLSSIDFEAANTILQSSDGNYLVGNCVMYSGDPIEGTVYKIDPIGNLIWSKYYKAPLYLSGGTEPCKLIETSDGGYAFCGGSNYFFSGNIIRVFFVKTDFSGEAGCHVYDLPHYASIFLFPTTIDVGNAAFVTTTYSAIVPSISIPSITDTACFQTTGIQPAGIQEDYSIEVKSNDVTIESKNRNNYTISLYDINGKVIYSDKSNARTTIKLNILSPGLYILRINSNGKSIAQKLIVEKTD